MNMEPNRKADHQKVKTDRHFLLGLHASTSKIKIFKKTIQMLEKRLYHPLFVVLLYNR